MADALAGRIMALEVVASSGSWSTAKFLEAETLDSGHDRTPFSQRRNMPALWQNQNRVGPPGAERAKGSKVRKAGQLHMEGERERKRQEREELVEGDLGSDKEKETDKE